MAKNCLEGERAAPVYGMEEGWQRPLPEKGWLEEEGSVALFSTRREGTDDDNDDDDDDDDDDTARR